MLKEAHYFRFSSKDERQKSFVLHAWSTRTTPPGPPQPPRLRLRERQVRRGHAVAAGEYQVAVGVPPDRGLHRGERFVVGFAVSVSRRGWDSWMGNSDRKKKPKGGPRFSREDPKHMVVEMVRSPKCARFLDVARDSMILPGCLEGATESRAQLRPRLLPAKPSRGTRGLHF